MSKDGNCQAGHGRAAARPTPLLHLTGEFAFQSHPHRFAFLVARRGPGAGHPSAGCRAMKPGLSSSSLHRLGVASGLAAGAWLGAAEAPTKLVTVGFSPFIISLG